MDNPMIFKFKVIMNDHLDQYKEEDIVKNLWPHMYGFLTRRRGCNNGTITLENGAVEIRWTYTYRDDEEWFDEHCDKCGQEVKGNFYDGNN